MKTAFKNFFAAILFFATSIAPLWAQTNEPDGIVASNAVAPPSVSIDGSGIHLVGSPNPGEIKLSNSVLVQNIAAMVFFFGTVAGLVGIIAHLEYRRNKLLHETLRAMIEKGAPIPPELIAKSDRTRRPGSDLRWGLVVTAFGLGVTALVGRIGLIFLLVGLAFLVVWMVEKRSCNNEPAGK